MRIAIYTAIIGDYDTLKEPLIKPKGVDFICFTDSDITSKHWKVIRVDKGDLCNTRMARKIKILPHRYLADYDYSIWHDGNFQIHGDITTLIDESRMRAFNHIHCRDGRSCIYDEADAIIALENDPRIKKEYDDPAIVANQVWTYVEEGYPTGYGLIASGILLRRHNDLLVSTTMEVWWNQVKHASKRDQLSFNYSAWKTGLQYNPIELDIRNNPYMQITRHNAS